LASNLFIVAAPGDRRAIDTLMTDRVAPLNPGPADVRALLGFVAGVFIPDAPDHHRDVPKSSSISGTPLAHLQRLPLVLSEHPEAISWRTPRTNGAVREHSVWHHVSNRYADDVHDGLGSCSANWQLTSLRWSDAVRSWRSRPGKLHKFEERQEQYSALTAGRRRISPAFGGAAYVREAYESPASAT
jgi:hypothetical protein